MKNFKKVLALVLAVATVFTFAAMATAAEVKYADLTDTASIEHVEAVQVLTGLGVIQGFEDKTFKPAESVTRVQMAKMVGFIMNDGDDINDLYKAACPFADSKSNWGAGYIAYCATQGIVNGRNATTFDPNATVTGAEAAKMLLCAMGYDATIEGFVGADWSVNVLNVAKKAGLLKELSQGKMGAALNREDAAQMIFNALKAEEVEYETKGTTVEINGATIATGASKATTVETVHKQFHQDVAVKTPLLWGEDHFIDESDTAKQLQKASNPGDDFGVTSSVWYYGKDDDGKIEIAKTLTLAKTFTGVVTAQDIYALTGKIDVDADKLTIKVDGVNGTVEGTATFAEWTDPKTAGKSAINDYTATQRAKNKILADEIAVYVDDNDNDGRDIQIIGKNYYIGSIYEHKSAKTVSDKEYVKIATEYGGIDEKYETTAFTDADAEDETEVILTYSVKEGKIESVKKVDAVKSGAVKKIAKDSDDNIVITADGKTYTFTKAFTDTNPTIDIDAEYDLFLDPNGKVIWAEETKSGSSDYFMVMKKAASKSETLDDNSESYKVRLLGTDGKTIDLSVAQIDGKDVNATNFAALTAALDPDEDQDIAACTTGAIVTYTLNNKGEAKLVKTSADFETDNKTIAADYDDMTGIATMLTTKKATSRTTFVLISLDKNDNYVYTPVSGISAMKAALGNYNYYKNVTVNDEPSKGAAFNAAVSFIFVDSRNVTSTKTVFTTLGQSSEKVEKDGNNTYTYREVIAIEGSEIKTLKVLADTGNKAYSKITKTFVVASSYTVNDDGFVSAINLAATGYDQTVKAGDLTAFEYKNGVLTINDLTSAQDEVKVYLYDTDAEEFNARNARTVKLADIDGAVDLTYVYNTNGSGTKTVTAVFAQEKA